MDKPIIPPFRMVGNLYFVGTYAASAHLIDTGEGLILIDTGYAETAPVILEGMQTLGFDVHDVKIILHSHGHRDHVGGTPELAELSGAVCYLHPTDRRFLDDVLPPTRDIADGDVIRLGNTEILCLETPGHTMGTVSFFWDIITDGGRLRAGMFGGAGVNQIKKPFLRERQLSYLKRGYYFDSLERLSREHVDVFVGNHSWNNHTYENYQKMQETGENPFIDPTAFPAFLKKCERKLRQQFDNESKTDFVNYAHRGASEYAPENTATAFDLGLSMGANGIETDVRRTCDGHLVLFHDKELDRVTDGSGSFDDYTWEELSRLSLEKNGRVDRIMTLDEFLARYAKQEIHFAIELKAAGIARDVVDRIYRSGIEKKCTVTSFLYDELLAVRAYDPKIRTGYLAKSVDAELLARMRADGIEELCPRATDVTPERVREWHRAGFNVRAWGVKTEELMHTVYAANADGMTLNFPDKFVPALPEEA